MRALGVHDARNVPAWHARSHERRDLTRDTRRHHQVLVRRPASPAGRAERDHRHGTHHTRLGCPVRTRGRCVCRVKEGVGSSPPAGPWCSGVNGPARRRPAAHPRLVSRWSWARARPARAGRRPGSPSPRTRLRRAAGPGPGPSRRAVRADRSCRGRPTPGGTWRRWPSRNRGWWGPPCCAPATRGRPSDGPSDGEGVVRRAPVLKDKVGGDLTRAVGRVVARGTLAVVEGAARGIGRRQQRAGAAQVRLCTGGGA